MTDQGISEPFQGALRCETAFFLSVLAGIAAGIFGGIAALLAAVVAHRFRRIGTSAAWCVLAGTGAALLALAFWHVRWNAIPCVPQAGTFAFEITDRRLGGEHPGMDSRILYGRLLAMTPVGEASRSCGETIGFLLPGGSPVPVCGSVVRCSGVLRPVSGARSGFFASRGIRRILYVDEVHSTVPPQAGIVTALEKLRTLLAGYLFRDVTSDRVRALAGAMIFGSTGGMTRELRSSFTGSGTVHLFSISGMHVAMLAALLFGVLRPLPLNWRMPLIVMLLGIAVAVTGAGIPALRAFAMIAVWCVLRIFLYSTPALNVMLLTGAVMLLAEPALAADVGAQYSFAITALLLKLAGRFRAEQPVREAVAKLMPESPLRRQYVSRQRLRSRFFGAFSGCSAAFFGSSTIGAAAQGVIPLGAVPANLLLTLFLPLVFFAVLLKGLLTAVGLSQTGAFFLTAAFDLLYGIAAAAERVFGQIVAAPLPWWGAALGLALLFWTVGAVRFRKRIAAFALFLLLGAGWLLAPRAAPPVLTVIAGDAATPPVIVLGEGNGACAVMINAPDHASVRRVLALLRARGVGEIRMLGFSSPRVRNASAAGMLAGEIEVDQVVLPAADPGSGAFWTCVERDVDARGWCAYQEIFKISEKKEDLRLEYSDRGSTLSFVLDIQRSGGGWRPVLQRPGAARIAGPVLAWSNRTTEWSYEFR